MRELTETMRRVLLSLESDDEGAPVQIYHRGTIDALMRRGEIEFSHDGERVFLPAHKHQFKSTLHIDGCHHYSSAYACSCGVTCSTLSERSLAADPYSAVWMEDTGDPCTRCDELKAGARPRHQVTIVRPRAKAAA